MPYIRCSRCAFTMVGPPRGVAAGDCAYCGTPLPRLEVGVRKPAAGHEPQPPTHGPTPRRRRAATLT